MNAAGGSSMTPEKPVTCSRCHGVFFRDPTWVVLRRAVNSLPAGAVGRVATYVKLLIPATTRSARPHGAMEAITRPAEPPRGS